ncbi:hypothetical protein INR49_003027 [Caranx melampygus]|nr:hypothetical protein INR49_003027 [Caranx melampygus]
MGMSLGKPHLCRLSPERTWKTNNSTPSTPVLLRNPLIIAELHPKPVPPLRHGTATAAFTPHS